MKAQNIAVLLSICAISSVADQLHQPAAIGGSASGVSDPYNMPPAQVASEFARIRRDQIEQIAREEKLTVPKEMSQLLRCAEKNDWDGTKGAWRVLGPMSGQYERRLNDASGIAVATNTDFHVLWSSVLEVYGFSEQVYLWDPGLLSLYAKEMLKDLPPGAILLGGTDPGRFVPTAYLAVQHETNRFVITQNALADNRYMSYLRRMHGDIQIPSTNECTNVFTEHAKAVQSGKIPPDGTRMVNGNVTIEGVGGVMAINGVLSRLIFEKNKDKHSFYVEESYVLQWMYPNLEPAGLIMKVNANPTPLTEEMVSKDRQYWDAYTQRLLSHPDYEHDDSARKAFSKMRCAIAGLYASHKRFDDAEYAFKQARSLYPASPEASFRLADLYCNTKRSDSALEVVNALLQLDPKNQMARNFADQIEKLKAAKEAVQKKWVGKMVMIESATDPQQCLGQETLLCVMVKKPERTKAESIQFKVCPGLADSTLVSFESVTEPGAFLRHQGGRLKLHPRMSDDLYKADATFQVIHGLADPGCVSFESANYPGCIVAANEKGEVSIVANPDKQRATFRLVPVSR